MYVIADYIAGDHAIGSDTIILCCEHQVQLPIKQHLLLVLMMSSSLLELLASRRS